MELVFNIIFMPGTVRYLRLAVLSLLRYSSYRYRLIGNALDRNELRLLGDFCDSSDRLHFFAFPVKAPCPHGVLLSILQQRERGSHFCFMDSDIFASAPFQAELEAHLGECDVFSSCELLRMQGVEAPQGYEGTCLSTPSGLPLATTFFAVYRNELLRRVIQETGVGFEPYYFVEQYPMSIRRRLEQLGAGDAVKCDTGKLLNVLSHAYGMRYRYAPLDALMHIGGITKVLAKPGRLKERLARFLRRPYVLRDQDIQMRESNLLKRLWNSRGAISRDANGQLRRRDRIRKRRIAAFFGFFLQSLVDGTPEPVLALNDAALAQRITSLCAAIRAAHREHRSAA